MNIKIFYKDKLLTISENAIVFHRYYFPIKKDKIVAFKDVHFISVLKPTIWNGKWRIHGTGNFKTWFPKDSGRPQRDRIFIAHLKTQRINIGFTAEDGDAVEKLLRSKNLINKGESETHPGIHESSRGVSD